MSWRQGTIYRTMKFSTPCGVPVEGWVSDVFGLHRVEYRFQFPRTGGGRGWNITHLKTGMGVGILDMDLPAAKRWVDELAGMEVWNDDRFILAPHRNAAVRAHHDHPNFIIPTSVEYWSITHEPTTH